MNIQKYLPSKKIQITLIVILAIAIGYLVFVLIKNNTATGEEKRITVALVDDSRSDDYYIDTDNDGAYDWQEALWPELDPENPDSDGDGILDGRYIKIQQSIRETQRRTIELPESNLSETEKLGRSAYTALFAISQTDGGLDSQTEQQFSDNIATHIGDLTLGEKLYTRDQLLLVEDTKENIYAYRDRMKTLLAKYPVATSDIELLLAASEDPTRYSSRLKTISFKYADYLAELELTQTPHVIAGRHTELINNISQMSGATDNLLEEEIDELVSLAFLVQVEKILNQTADALIHINTFFEIVEDESLFTE